MKSSIFILSVLTVAMLWATSSVAQSREAALEREEYAVYSALITQLYVRDGRRSVIIVDHTCCGDAATSKGFAFYPYQTAAPVPEGVFENFRRRNSERLPLKRLFNLPTDYRLVEITELIKLIKSDQDSKDFYAKYPDSHGFVSLSGIGFNPRRNQAFVYSNMVCGITCQEGKFIVLSKKRRAWKVTNVALHTVYPT